jgi:hypothetical protein
LVGEREETVTPSASAPEQKARAQIDAALVSAGWIVQDRDEMNLAAGRGVAVREFKLTTGHGFASEMSFLSRRPTSWRGALDGILRGSSLETRRCPNRFGFSPRRGSTRGLCIERPSSSSGKSASTGSSLNTPKI